MDTQLVTTDDAQRLAQSFGKSIEASAAELDELYETLRAMAPSKFKAEFAIEVGQKAKRYIGEIDSSEPREIATNLDKAHKIFVKAITRWRKRGELALKLSQDTLSEWKLQSQRKAEEERRRKEQEANRAVAEQREAELQHLREIGKAQEAEQLSLMPVRTVSVSVDPDAGKVEGADMVPVWVPKRDENNNFVFREGANDDEAAYRAWITKNSAMWHLQSYEYGKTKKLLTDHRGILQPPGLVIEQKFEPRIRKESDD